MIMSPNRRFPAIAMTTAGVAFACATFWLSNSSPIQQAEAQQPTPLRTGGDAVRNADELIRNLGEARKALGGVSNRGTRDKLELLITRAELQANDLRKDLIGVLSSSATVRPMSDADFAKLLAQVKKEAFDNNRVDLVKQISTGNRFTSAQAREILKTFAFDQGRSDAALALYPQVVDPGNFFQALDVFSFDSAKRDVMKKLTPKK